MLRVIELPQFGATIHVDVYGGCFASAKQIGLPLTLPRPELYSVQTRIKMKSAAPARLQQLQHSRALLARSLSDRGVGSESELRLGIIEHQTGPVCLQSKLHSGISHTRGSSGESVCAVAIAPARVGVDIENISIRRDFKRIAKRVLTSAELGWMSEKEADLGKRFYALWTLREAALKAGYIRLVSDPIHLVLGETIGADFPFYSEQVDDFLVTLVLNPGTQRAFELNNLPRQRRTGARQLF
jgi:4'-phosphopantetheinyl transferase superfamily